MAFVVSWLRFTQLVKTLRIHALSLDPNGAGLM